MKKFSQGNIIMQIIFSKKLYDPKTVNAAVKAYKELADFSVSENKSQVIVTLKNINDDVKNVIKDEFCNYILATMRK